MPKGDAAGERKSEPAGGGGVMDDRTRFIAASLACLLSSAVAGLAPLPAHAQTAGLGAAGELVDPDRLRVCADPSNMPFSDESGQGFEDKLAGMVASSTGRSTVAYTWFPSITGFVRNTLGANRCDIIMGYAQGDELVQNTNAYYRSSYVLVYPRKGALAGVDTLADPKLGDKRIGVVEGTPPTAHMAAARLMGKAKIYPLLIDTRVAPSMAEVMIRDMQSGVIDAAVVWGPMAGYYAKTSGADLAVVPLIKEKGGQRMVYRITMGVRPSDQHWKRTLNTFIRDHQDDINKLLLDYGVPLLNEHDQAITQ
jgi:mxaJ protein